MSIPARTPSCYPVIHQTIRDTTCDDTFGLSRASTAVLPSPSPASASSPILEAPTRLHPAYRRRPVVTSQPPHLSYFGPSSESSLTDTEPTSLCTSRARCWQGLWWIWYYFARRQCSSTTSSCILDVKVQPARGLLYDCTAATVLTCIRLRKATPTRVVNCAPEYSAGAVPGPRYLSTTT